jgi:HK97 family phage prohead protease
MISRRGVTATEQSIDGRTLAGYAAVYGQDSRTIVENGRQFTERIAPGAFNETLSTGADVKLFYNHDTSMPLARTKSGTLTLKSDRNGLAFSAALPETTLGNDVRALIERGDLTGEMSFGFVVQQDSWNKDRTERLVKRAQLLEVSIVQDAAYPQTSSSLRSVSAAYLDAANLRLALHFRRMAENVR